MKDRRELVLISGTSCKRYVLKKDTKPIVVVRHRIYRVDVKLAKSTTDGRRTMNVYNLDSTQPLGHTTYLDPDITMAILDAGGIKKKNTTVIPKFNTEVIAGAIAVLCVIYALVMGGL